MGRNRAEVTPYGREVKKRLIDKDMTQAELAARLGCQQSYLFKIFSGIRSGRKYRQKIQEILELDETV